MYDNDNDTRPVQNTREYAEHRNQDVQNGPEQTPGEWLAAFFDNRVKPDVDTGESQLFIHEPYTGANEPNRYRLRLRHPDSGETDISPALDAGEFEAYLFGLVHGLNGEIEREVHGADE